MSFLDINDKNNKLNMFIKKYLNIASSSFVKSKNKNKNDNIVLTGNNFLGGNIIDELLIKHQLAIPNYNILFFRNFNR